MEHSSESAVAHEVEALRAIYDDSNIAFHPGNVTSATTVTIALDGLTTCSPSCLTLTTKLPSSYPETHPQSPVLRSDSLTASECECLVDEMMQMQTAPKGEVCLYDWFQAMITILNDHEVIATENVSTTIEDDQSVTNQFDIYHGEPLTDRKSVFQAHVASISKPSDVEDVLKTLRSLNKKVESATHNMLAYRVMGTHGVVQDSDDDGEKGAGKVVLHVVQRLKVVNVVVIVSRWFGGIKLGPVRFRHIAKVVADALPVVKGKLRNEEG